MMTSHAATMSTIRNTHTVGQWKMNHMECYQHTRAASDIHMTSITLCSSPTAELAVSLEVRTYADIADLPAKHDDFVSIALELLGPMNRKGLEFITELGRRVAAATGNPPETAHLFQRLSICTPRPNAQRQIRAQHRGRGIAFMSLREYPCVGQM